MHTIAIHRRARASATPFYTIGFVTKDFTGRPSREEKSLDGDVIDDSGAKAFESAFASEKGLWHCRRKTTNMLDGGLL